MADGVKQCPKCGSALGSDYRGTIIVWECPKAHGIGVNIFEAVGYLQRDEIDAIWSGAQGAPLSKLNSPVSGRLMNTVTFTADDDTDYDNVGANAQTMTVEVDAENYFAWFSVEALNAMPTVDSAPPIETAAGLVGLTQLDEGEAKFDHVFDHAESYAMEKKDPYESGLGGMLSGLARHISR